MLYIHVPVRSCDIVVLVTEIRKKPKNGLILEFLRCLRFKSSSLDFLKFSSDLIMK